MSARIALGFCNNVDYEIVWRAEVLQELAIRYQIRAGELRTRPRIDKERDLVLSILSFMAAGAGGERFVGNSDIIERFAARFETKITLGGTSVRAAIAMQKLGVASALHLITQNDHVRRLVPAECPWVCSNARDSAYPHLIVQYGGKDRLRANDIDIRARQPNRLIYHCNADRIAMRLNEDFADLAAEAQALLVSGFNAMQSERLLRKRLAAVKRILERAPEEATVYLEDGGYFEPAFRQVVYRELGRRLDVYGMNEDELRSHLGRSLDLRDAAQVKGALEALRGRLPAKTLVLHTQHWALASGEGARRYTDALRAGVALATTRFRHGDDWTLGNYREIADIPPDPVDALFAESIQSRDIACAPVPAVDQHRATTIGLGDAFVGGFLAALAEA